MKNQGLENALARVITDECRAHGAKSTAFAIRVEIDEQGEASIILEGLENGPEVLSRLAANMPVKARDVLSHLALSLTTEELKETPLAEMLKKRNVGLKKLTVLSAALKEQNFSCLWMHELDAHRPQKIVEKTEKVNLKQSDWQTILAVFKKRPITRQVPLSILLVAIENNRNKPVSGGAVLSGRLPFNQWKMLAHSANVRLRFEEIPYRLVLKQTANNDVFGSVFVIEKLVA